ncbi:MAG: redoxin domain-containing protein, partial [Candidatus Nanopelagicales bacterium]
MLAARHWRAAALAGHGRRAAAVGQPAPDFTLTDTDGKTVTLADFKGKHVVLEWTNPGCPFVRKHYDAANMQATAEGGHGARAWSGWRSTRPRPPA